MGEDVLVIHDQVGPLASRTTTYVSTRLLTSFVYFVGVLRSTGDLWLPSADFASPASLYESTQPVQ